MFWNECMPNCGVGHLASTRVAVVLFDPATSAKGFRYFTELDWVITGPDTWSGTAPRGRLGRAARSLDDIPLARLALLNPRGVVMMTNVLNCDLPIGKSHDLGYWLAHRELLTRLRRRTYLTLHIAILHA